MKFMLLIYGNPKNWEHPIFLHPPDDLTEADREALLAADTELFREIESSGELITAFALGHPSDAKLVSATSGTMTATDGPYAESKEFLAGTFIFECESMDRAVEIAAKFPDIRYGTIEIRPLM